MKELRKTYIWTCAAVMWFLSAMTVPAQTLSTGMSGSSVTELQNDLVEAGYFARTVDGAYGSSTAAAVKLFQKDHGLRVTGIADDATQRKIEKSIGNGYRKGGGVVMSEGNRGDDVAEFQQALINAGFLNDGADGVYGQATAKAVKAFQKEKGLPVSGVIDEETYAALGGIVTDGGDGNDRPSIDPDELRNIQKKLIAGGYLDGAADGLWGSQTAGAVRSFQEAKGLSPTGELDSKTVSMIKKISSGSARSSSGSLRLGSNGPKVVRLQNLLSLHGFAPGTVDGVFGPGTEERVKEFERYHGLSPDGVVGNEVWEKLESAPVFFGNYKEMLRMQSTAYTPYDGGGTGRTALGNIAGKGHAAVDPSVIPLGSILYIEDYGYAIADDIGGSINGYIVDVGVDTLEQAYRWGNRRVNVYIVR